MELEEIEFTGRNTFLAADLYAFHLVFLEQLSSLHYNMYFLHLIMNSFLQINTSSLSQLLQYWLL